MVKNRSVRVWWFVVLFAAAALPRLPVVPAGFTIDDPLMVEHAEASGGPAQVLIESWPPGLYRPLVALHFEVCRVLFGSWAPGYHMVSIALHVVVTWLVFCSASGCRPQVGRLCVRALGFAMLPVLNEAIAWTASVGDLLATGSRVASVLLALSAAESRAAVGGWLWAASLVAMVMGMMAQGDRDCRRPSSCRSPSGFRPAPP